jgi:hypothetical protein
MLRFCSRQLARARSAKSMLREVFLNPMIISGVEVIEMIGRYHREDRNTIENNKLFIDWTEKFRTNWFRRPQAVMSYAKVSLRLCGEFHSLELPTPHS